LDWYLRSRKLFRRRGVYDPLVTHYIRDALPRADSIRLKHEALLQTYEKKTNERPRTVRLQQQLALYSSKRALTLSQKKSRCSDKQKLVPRYRLRNSAGNSAGNSENRVLRHHYSFRD
jgi:hypothetical protein